MMAGAVVETPPGCPVPWSTSGPSRHADGWQRVWRTPPVSEVPGELLGLAASPGTVRGPAQMLQNLAAADKLEAGDILVAATTLPPWTPLFAHSAGVMTDAGAMLSHPAVVARDDGIPAVVGTRQTTTMMHDGQVVDMDGKTGVVRLV